ncbi:MAG: NUDIX hydrolase [Candidatus Firestonebacteria bacterium]
MKEKLVKRNTIYKGRILNFFVDDVKLPDGNKSTREVVQHPGAVTIIPLLNKYQVVLVKQYRYAIQKLTFEFPAGTLHKGENPLLCAKRELTEETGYRAKLFKKLITFYTAPGFCSELMHLFLATGLTKLSSQNLDVDEFVEMEEMSLKSAFKMLRSGRIIDSKTIIGLLLLKEMKC